MTRIFFLYFLFLIFCVVHSSAQEVVTGLQFNPTITNSVRNQKITKGVLAPDTLELPFFDDFSGRSIFPDSKRWLDQNVFINNTYSDRQISIGIATFDALNSTGRMYETASSTGFKADELTSKPINLNYAASDNVWFSFFYQAGGLSDQPEPRDSLTLQFLAPSENKWYSVWKVEGNSDLRFKPVILKIDNARFLEKGFQFRFMNYASISSVLTVDPSMVGNCDIWNVDYILLGKNRNSADTVFADVAFRLPLRSLLKNHEAMPWKQFSKIELQEMGSSIPIHYRNNDKNTRNVTRDFEIWDSYKNTQSDFFSAGAADILASTNVDYKANLVYTFNTTNTDSALFRITCSLKTDQFDPKGNDTLIYYQVFNDYFAFDDGTSESGYGINGLGSRNAMAAYRFSVFVPDTLRAIRICFNDSYLDANKRGFDLMVWDDENGVPGKVLYTKEEVLVEQGSFINGFYTYYIPDGVTLSNTFYVGWRQRSESFLNAGLDINTPNAGRQFYWINGQWQQSQVQGSLMIRPVVGNRPKVTAINNVYSIDKKIITVWPNPATDHINIKRTDLQQSGFFKITIMDLTGRELIRTGYSEQIDISSLQEGIYIIITSINGKPVGYNRIIKSM
jgi:hypothetical protein